MTTKMDVRVPTLDPCPQINVTIEGAGSPGKDGAQGPQGEPGEAATISNVTASVDDTSGDPEVVVTMGGTAQERSFAFAFSGLKGENGKAPVKGVDYWTSEDQQSIVDQVLQDLPNGDEVEY